jgi:beta-glucosidase
MSERAAREIYLKSFEYAVREGHPTSLMTSYNPINGIWSANNYDLNTLILREEWGYEGLVMTDWWPKLSAEKNDEYMNLINMVEGQNDVYMPTTDALTFKDNLPTAIEKGALCRGQLQRNAMNVLKYISNSHALERFIKYGGKLEKSLVDSLDSLSVVGEIATPEADKVYEIKANEPGMHLVGIEYYSNEPDISQMCVGLFVDEKSAASLTVNGTLGEKKIAYRDVSVVNTDMKISASFPDKLVTITKIVVLK